MAASSFYTLGCRANQYQTEVIKNLSHPDGAYIINTCAVTEDAERKSRQAIRRALRLGEKVIVSGCYARLKGEEIKRLFPQVEIIDLNPFDHRPSPLARRIRVNLMIQDGCEHFCSYCIVPFVRGKIKSKQADEVFAEAAQLVNSGAREIILTGINLGTYQFNLSSLVRRLSSIVGLLRIRLSSIEPMYLSKELIDTVASTPKACRHLHIPLQSGDDKILKAMNRDYSGADYLEKINYIRGKIPDCGITTDIIVGFPGEGEKEFRSTVDLINKAKFSRLHIFPYSKRKGTPAADFPDQVDAATKKQRSDVLHELRKKHMEEFANQYLGKEVEILVEQKGEGLTSNYIRCFFKKRGTRLSKVSMFSLKDKVPALFITRSAD